MKEILIIPARPKRFWALHVKRNILLLNAADALLVPLERIQRSINKDISL